MTFEHLLVIAKEENQSRMVSKITSRYNSTIKKIMNSNLDDEMKDYCLAMHFNKTINNLSNSILNGKTLTHFKNYLNAVYRKNKLTKVEYT